MEIPMGSYVDAEGNYVLQILLSIHGSKQAGWVWFLHLAKKCFTQLTFFPTIFVRGNCIYVLYMDDSFLTGPNCKDLLQVEEDLKAAGLQITVEGNIADFLGVNISNDSKGKIQLTQPQLIDSFLKVLNLNSDKAKGKSTPVAVSKLLHGHQDASVFDGHFYYQCIIGKLNYLEKSTRPDFFTTHQVAWFSADPKQPHADAVKWLGCYLKATCDKGLVLQPTSKSIDVYVDADFARNWNKNKAAAHSYTVHSRHAYNIMYTGCPVHWASQLRPKLP